MICADKTRLLKAYQVTTENYARTVTELQQLRATIPIEEYQRLNHACEEARLKSSEARLALEKHIFEHQC